MMSDKLDDLIHPEAPKGKNALAQSLTLKLSDYSHLSYTKEELEHIRKRMTNLRTGATAAIPLICAGQSCIFKARCPFLEVGKPPTGRVCLVETSLLNQWRSMFIEEYDIDPNSLTEILFVNELAELELMLYRINSNLAKPEYAELVNENPVGVDKDGNPITRLEINALFEARMRINEAKKRTIKLMVGDRQEQYKKRAALRTADDTDPSKQASALRAQIESISAKAKILDAEMSKDLKQLEAHKETLSPEDLLEADDE
jgi:hypothetical protein